MENHIKLNRFMSGQWLLSFSNIWWLRVSQSLITQQRYSPSSQISFLIRNRQRGLEHPYWFPWECEGWLLIPRNGTIQNHRMLEFKTTWLITYMIDEGLWLGSKENSARSHENSRHRRRGLLDNEPLTHVMHLCMTGGGDPMIPKHQSILEV